MTQLVGDPPAKGGHYFTVWAPRQTGKSWITIQAMARLRTDPRFYAVKVDLQVGGIGEDFLKTANYIFEVVNFQTGLSLPSITKREEFQKVFTLAHLDKPLLLVLDEFDSLEPDTIQQIVGQFRNLYLSRKAVVGLNLMTEAPNLIHGVCLIGVRSVLGVENVKGSPFNVQRSMHIPNLTEAEVREMFDWYQRESGQVVEPEVVERLFYETRGQPGLTSWFGELLTETYNDNPDRPIGMDNWRHVYLMASQALPDNNILNIISKTTDPRYQPTVLELFRTDTRMEFSFDVPELNYLYMNGVVTFEKSSEDGEEKLFAKFPCPYVQKRLFNRFRRELFGSHRINIDPFDDMEDAVKPDSLDVPRILDRYQRWLDVEGKKPYFLKGAPRRAGMRICEAVWHFNLFHFLYSRFTGYPISVHPEFPTGNGKVDLLLGYKGSRRYAIEVKAYQDAMQYRNAIREAAEYAHSLGLDEITLAFFIDAIDDTHRARLEQDRTDPDTGVKVSVKFLVTGGCLDAT